MHAWTPDREAEQLPAQPAMVDLWLKNNAEYGGYQARRIWQSHPVLLTRFVFDLEDLGAAVSLVREELSPEEIRATLFIVSSEEVVIQNFGISS